MIIHSWVKYCDKLATTLIIIGSGILFISMKEEPGLQFQEKVNLALRKTADGLLKLAGDSTSRIPNVIHTNSNVWQVELNGNFCYDSLPSILQSSLDLHRIENTYSVSIKKCDDNIIEMGYHQLDYKNKNVPCSGRQTPGGCHYLEVRFTDLSVIDFSGTQKMAVVFLTLLGLLGTWAVSRKIFQRQVLATKQEKAENWIQFGKSRLNVKEQTLICVGTHHKLTFRESKLLNLFATNPDKLLSRDQILQQVWADEGLLVGRSIDVFVSRLRKKLTADTSIFIAVVHGVGYKLESVK